MMAGAPAMCAHSIATSPKGTKEMGIFKRVRAWLSGGPAPDSSPPEEQSRYDRVRIVNVVDGTTIEGHDAVKAHFEEEQQLLDEHGSTITFQVFRIDLAAATIGELQGKQLIEIKVPSDFASGGDTVAAVKNKLRPLIDDASRSHPDAVVRRALTLLETDTIAFSFSNRRMLDEKLFYADHFMLLPVWVQVLLHDCDHEELMAVAAKLHAKAANRDAT